MHEIHPSPISQILEFIVVAIMERTSEGDTSKNLGGICFACFFPCVVLGEMHSSVVREDSIGLFEPCKLNIGCNGCIVCLETSTCCVFGFPFVGCYVCIQRYYLSKIYPNDVKFNAAEDCFGCLWPNALWRHKQLFERKQQQSLLHYPWAYDIPHRKDHDAVHSLRVLALLVGPKKSGKSSLFKKLCGNADSATGQNTEVNIGTTGVYSMSGPLAFEIWDCPPDSVENCVKYRPDCIILTFDSTNRESFIELQVLNRECFSNLNQKVRRVCVATKIDLWNKDFAAVGDVEFELNTAVWRERCFELAVEAEQWAKKNDMGFVLTSCPLNEGIVKLMRVVCSDIKNDSLQHLIEAKDSDL